MNETGANDVRQGVVVVGTDGSKGSLHALRFAFEEALRRGVGAEVVTAWTVTSPYTDDYSAPVLDEARERATEVQDKAVARALDGMDLTPPISRSVVHGYGGSVLVEAARDAAVLVVGHTQRSRLARAITGSVSAECLRNSSVPVILVPVPDPSDHASPQHQALAESPATDTSTT